MQRFPDYQPGYLVLEGARKDFDNFTYGHCRSSQRGFDQYFPLEMPADLQNRSFESLFWSTSLVFVEVNFSLAGTIWKCERYDWGSYADHCDEEEAIDYLEN